MKDMAMKVTLEKGDKKLREIIHKAAKGEEVLVSDGDGADFKVEVTPVPKKLKERKFGSAKGLIWMSDDFDDPIPGLEPYMP